MNLTPKQQITLDIIAEYWNKNGFAPSVADIRSQLGLKSNSNGTILFRLKSLEREHLITKNPRIARSIKLTKEGQELVSRVDPLHGINVSSTSPWYQADQNAAQISNYSMKERI